MTTEVTVVLNKIKRCDQCGEVFRSNKISYEHDGLDKCVDDIKSLVRQRIISSHVNSTHDSAYSDTVVVDVCKDCLLISAINKLINKK